MSEQSAVNVEDLKRTIGMLRASFRIVFQPLFKNNDFLASCDDLLNSMAHDLESLVSPVMITGSEPDSIDLLNRLAGICREVPFHRQLDRAVYDALFCQCPEIQQRNDGKYSADTNFYLEHTRQIALLFKELIPKYISWAEQQKGNELSRILPSAQHLNSTGSVFQKLKTEALAFEVRRCSMRQDIFDKGRVFRHRNGIFELLELPDIRQVSGFFGYSGARQMFLDHFKAFSEGHSNLPLLISSLPGLGKTQMTIAYTLFYDNLTLIVPDPEDLSSGFELLIRQLAACQDHKFMIFFDDIDVQKTDWYSFRSNVGGTFSLPSNITVTIASNQQFPANISSRGRGFVFPMFDEIRCQEMISDFLMYKGMEKPSSELVSVIASDYVEQFGQKLFEELSPRTLVRYLDVYNVDAKKRREMLEVSRGEMITRPDSQVFYEENLKLMRSIYGPEIVDRIRKEELNAQIS